MELPRQLECFADARLWVCYPLIPNPEKHNGLTGDTGYDKPPICPIPLEDGRYKLASSKKVETWGTYAEASAQLGKSATIYNHKSGQYEKHVLQGVGMMNPGGLIMFDLDGVVNPSNPDKDGKRTMTAEAAEIVKKLNSYTEISASGKGLHIVCFGELPEDATSKKAYNKHDAFKTELAEYEIICNTGQGTENEKTVYFGLTGDVVGNYELRDCTKEIIEVYDRYFRKARVESYTKTEKTGPDSSGPSVVSCCGVARQQWLDFIRRASDSDILQGIFESGSIGAQVKALYDGFHNYIVTGEKNHGQQDHSRADYALLLYLYGFTSDRALTLRLFKGSALYRPSGKSSNYLDNTLDRVVSGNPALFTGHVLSFTDDEKRSWAKRKEQEENQQIAFLTEQLKSCNSIKDAAEISRKIEALKQKQNKYKQRGAKH